MRTRKLILGAATGVTGCALTVGLIVSAGSGASAAPVVDRPPSGPQIGWIVVQPHGLDVHGPVVPYGHDGLCLDFAKAKHGVLVPGAKGWLRDCTRPHVG